MSGESKYSKSFSRLSKKSVWPATCLMVLSVVAVIVLVYGFVSFFTAFVIDMKMSQIKENSDNIQKMYSMEIFSADIDVDSDDEGETVSAPEGAGSHDEPGTHEGTGTDKKNNMFKDDGINSSAFMKQYLDTDEAVYVVDSDGNVVYSSGRQTPDLTSGMTIDYGTEYTFYQDKSGQKIAESDFDISLIRMLRTSFLKGENINNSDVADDAGSETASEAATEAVKDGSPRDWMQNDMIRTACWFKYELDNGSTLYVREIFSIKMQETFYISMVAVVAILGLCGLLCLLFINFIVNIANQRRVIKHLFTDMDTGGNSWTYFVVNSAKVFRKRIFRKKDFAVVAIHLNKYRDYCACYGVSAGEAIIKAMAGYFRVRLDKNELYARHSGADFALLMKYEDDEEFLARVNNILVELMGISSEQKLFFTAGVYIIDAGQGQHSEDCRCNLCNERDRKNIQIEQAYNYAYEAAVSNTYAGNSRVAFFSAELIDKQMWERKVEDSMEQALMNGEFVVYYQPKYDPVDNKLVGAEALTRWVSPTEGLIPPGRFIPLFEKNGFITRLDDYVFATVAKQQAEWKINGIKTVPVSVNLSRVHFAQDELAKSICNIVDSYGVEHKMIEVEITESAFIANKSKLKEVITDLRSFGFVVSMDDFGSGYSSLNTLKELPLDVVKIDREFFVGDGYDDKGKLIVSSVIKLAKSMRMKVVAEGVEQEDQIDFLVDENCDMIQSFYYAKPMPSADFAKLVARDA